MVRVSGSALRIGALGFSGANSAREASDSGSPGSTLNGHATRSAERIPDRRGFKFAVGNVAILLRAQCELDVLQLFVDLARIAASGRLGLHHTIRRRKDRPSLAEVLSQALVAGFPPETVEAEVGADHFTAGVLEYLAIGGDFRRPTRSPPRHSFADQAPLQCPSPFPGIRHDTHWSPRTKRE
jgi:hypothetical protein